MSAGTSQEIDQQSASAKSSETHQRLLEAAGQVFADRGFYKATVREICELAQANVAAVNYHFRDKAGLYREVLKYASQCACERYHDASKSSEGQDPEEELREFILIRLQRIFDRGRPSWHGKLMAREMMEPTPALSDIVESEIRPKSQQLERIVRRFLGEQAPAEQVGRCVLSIIGQCLFYHHAQPVIRQLYPAQVSGPREIERLADHITGFSLGALEALKRHHERGHQ